MSGSKLKLDQGERIDVLRGLYLGLLQREPDPAGLKHWLESWNAGMSVEEIAHALISSAEAQCGITTQRRCADAAAQAARTSALSRLDTAKLSRPIVIVDVGAQNLSNEDHVYAGLARAGLPTRVIGFEPLEHRRHERLQASAEHITLLPAFVGDGELHTFHVNEPDATSSLLPFNETMIRQLVDLDCLHTERTEEAATTTLDVALSAEEHIDFLKLDIQGFELAALRHATEVLQRTLVVHCEVSFLEIYEKQALFSEVELHMRRQGFELIDLMSMCHYPLAGNPYRTCRDRLGWADAVFMRRRGCAGEHWEDILFRSLIALIVYNKPSLACRFADGLDGTPAAPYKRALSGEVQFP